MVSGGGVISSTGLFTSDGTIGTFTVRATAHDTLAIWGETEISMGIALLNPGFETPVLTESYGYRLNPTDGDWVFAGMSGVVCNGNVEGSSNAPQGVQAGFLIGDTGIISQTIPFESKNYKVIFQVAMSPGPSKTLEVYYDDTKIGTVTPASVNFARFETPVFTATAGNHVLAFKGVTLSDESVFIDDVVLAPDARVNVSSGKLNSGIMALSGISPNPFSANARVTFEVPSHQHISIRIYDVAGRLCKTLLDGSVTAGRHTLPINRMQDNGKFLVNGTYFCRMQANGFEKTERFTLVR